MSILTKSIEEVVKILSMDADMGVFVLFNPAAKTDDYDPDNYIRLCDLFQKISISHDDCEVFFDVPLRSNNETILLPVNLETCKQHMLLFKYFQQINAQLGTRYQQNPKECRKIIEFFDVLNKNDGFQSFIFKDEATIRAMLKEKYESYFENDANEPTIAIDLDRLFNTIIDPFDCKTPANSWYGFALMFRELNPQPLTPTDSLASMPNANDCTDAPNANHYTDTTNRFSLFDLNPSGDDGASLTLDLPTRDLNDDVLAGFVSVTP